MSNGSTIKAKIIAAVFIGMVLGITLAGAVAWYVVQKNPSSFMSKGRAVLHQESPLSASAPVVAVTLPAINPAAPVVASGAAETQQHFEFYKVLTDKQDGTAQSAGTKPKQPAIAKTQPATTNSKGMFYVQAGAFQNVGDAEKLKAKLAFSGFEADIRTANIPDKGVWYRVRLGPYNGSEAGKTIVSLRQNGIVATQVQAQ